ncbi:M56 family metallopeptidase [Chitinophaga sp. GCM10012297]|uniref:M48 family metalloprotease n=1 Tax=Chitinophaga chungangae TaxID=2821488 RepID=A0ABS3Y9X8_9BACT|nr:M56 family metallopeptidase [Chitinophaga chungangae]MBO9151474.1 M48 family metalloprotease [Chitinophaga chungangae]
MTSLLPFTQDLIRAFGWTLLHSFWQAFFVFACLRIVLRLWPQASASIKYHLSYLSLAGIFGWFVATLYRQLTILREAQEIRQMVALQLRPDVLAKAAQHTPPPQADGLQVLFPGMESYFPLLVGIYVVGVTVMTIKLCVDLSQLRHVRRLGVTPMGPVWEQHLRELGKRLGISKKVQLFISEHLQVPVMIGFLKPVILLPAAMVSNLSPEQLEAILLHELAHIKRNDYLLNIFQSIVETILFFNPFVWWISRNIRQEREHCCDDLVIAGTVQPMHYAKALVALEEYRITANPMAMAAAHDKHFLLHRIKRIMEMKTKNLNYSQRFLALLIIVTGLVSIAWLSPDRKNGKKEKQSSVLQDTILPKPPVAPIAPGITPAPPAPPTPAPTADVSAPPAPPAPVAFASPTPFPAAAPEAPLAPLAPMPPMAPASWPAATPLPPTPPGPPNWVSYNNNYNGHYNGNFYFQDTLAPGQKIVIVDDKGNKKEYRSIDEMPAADRKRMEESFYKMQQAKASFQYKPNQDEIKQAMKNARAAIDNIDWTKMNAQISESMKNVDWEKINKQVSESMKNIDWQKMQTDLAKQMKEIQWDKISDQMKNQLKNQDWDKMNKDIRESLEKIDWKKIENDVKKAMENVKFDSSFHYNFDYDHDFDFDLDIDGSGDTSIDRSRARARAQHERNLARNRAAFDEARERNRKIQEEHVAMARARQQETKEKIKAQREEQVAIARARQQETRERSLKMREENMEKMKALREESMKKAEENRAKAEAVSKSYRQLLDGMEADKLIDRNAEYQVEKKGGDLFINGKKQSPDVLKKYEQYLKNDNVTIRGSKNSLNIQSNDNQ